MFIRQKLLIHGQGQPFRFGFEGNNKYVKVSHEMLLHSSFHKHDKIVFTSQGYFGK